MKIDVLDHGYVRLVDHLGDDLSIVNAARVSYDKESKDFSPADARLLDFLIREDHTSPLRHAALTFEVYAPLMVARQHWKYAVASTFVDDQNGWNESSRRYVTENEQYYTPKMSEWRWAPENSKQGSGGTYPYLVGTVDEPVWAPNSEIGRDRNEWANAGNYITGILSWYQEKGQELYEAVLKAGVAPEQARLFLPAYGLYVRYRWTVSLAGVLHFLDQRLAHDAQVEIQAYAEAVRDLTKTVFPKTLEAWLAK